MLMRYFWNTIEHCAPRGVILDQLAASGFVEVRYESSMDLVRTYSARKPDQRCVGIGWNELLSP
jgi:demethylmenaquinone methyltransferase / 2-methoxy-6-polyprenyl-1,4-benzoquinol methylase